MSRQYVVLEGMCVRLEVSMEEYNCTALCINTVGLLLRKDIHVPPSIVNTYVCKRKGNAVWWDYYD